MNRRPGNGAMWPVILLAVGLATALNLICGAILYEAIFRTESAGISENATQILTGWGGGIIGVVGAYVGYQVAKHPNEPDAPTDPTKPEQRG